MELHLYTAKHTVQHSNTRILIKHTTWEPWVIEWHHIHQFAAMHVVELRGANLSLAPRLGGEVGMHYDVIEHWSAFFELH